MRRWLLPVIMLLLVAGTVLGANGFLRDRQEDAVQQTVPPICLMETAAVHETASIEDTSVIVAEAEETLPEPAVVLVPRKRNPRSVQPVAEAVIANRVPAPDKEIPASPLSPSGKIHVSYNIMPALNTARQAVIAGDFETAQRIYTTVLEIMPDLDHVRLEYAAAARLAGKSDLIDKILIPIDVDALPPGERSAYRNIVWGETAFGLSFSPRLMFDSNSNGGPKKNTVQIGGLIFRLSDEDMPKSSAGVGGSLAGQAMWMPRPNLAFGVTGVVDADFYKESDENEITYTLSAGPRARVKDVLLRANVLGGQRFLGGSALEHNVGGQVAASFSVTQKTPVTVSLAQRFFKGDSSVQRDRTVTSLAASSEWSGILPWDGGVSVFTGIDREDWKRDIEDNSSYRAGAVVELPKNGYVDPVVMFTATRRLYDNEIVILGKMRREWRLEPSLRLDLSMVKTPFGTPYFQYTYIRNKSTISLTDYDQHMATAGLVIQAF